MIRQKLEKLARSTRSCIGCRGLDTWPNTAGGDDLYRCLNIKSLRFRQFVNGMRDGCPAKTDHAGRPVTLDDARCRLPKLMRAE